MAIEAGDAEEGTGLAGELADSLRDEIGRTFKVKDAAPALNAMAKAIVTYLLENLEVDPDTGEVS